MFETALIYMRKFLINRKQRANENNAFSSLESIVAVVPQDAV